MARPTPRSSWSRLRRRLRRAVLARRRLLAAAAAALAVLAGVQAASPSPAPTRLVLTAARDLPAGAVISAGDLEPVAFLPGSVPARALRSTGDAVGRTTAGPVRRGEPLTDVRLVGGSLLEGYPGLVAAPIRVADPGAVALLRVGDRVDVIAADPQARGDAALVAARAPVVALPRADDTALATGGLVVLAVDDATARSLASAAVSAYLSVTLTR